MRHALGLALMILSITSSGCALVQDSCHNVLVGIKTPLEEHRENARNRQWAETAWQQVCLRPTVASIAFTPAITPADSRTGSPSTSSAAATASRRWSRRCATAMRATRTSRVTTPCKIGSPAIATGRPWRATAVRAGGSRVHRHCRQSWTPCMRARRRRSWSIIRGRKARWHRSRCRRRSYCRRPVPEKIAVEQPVLLRPRPWSRT